MKTIIQSLNSVILKKTIQDLLFCGLILAAIYTAYSICQDVRALIGSRPAGTGISCLFNVMN